jgi:dihydrodipicolinate synthase/N-acetylneuraminate lyase
MDTLVERTVRVVAGRVPIFVGVGGNATHKVLETLKRLERHDVAGIVSVCPYYNRPDAGLEESRRGARPRERGRSVGRRPGEQA